MVEFTELRPAYCWITRAEAIPNELSQPITVVGLARTKLG